MPNELKTRLTDLINDPHFDTIELGLRKQNIFDILNIAKAEIRHSNFLAWLLNPKGNHGLNDIFLKRTIRDIFSDEKISVRDQFDVDLLNLENAEIRREWKNIDLLIILDDDVIIIENKTETEDHSNQLSRYKKIISETFPDKNRRFVCLTPFGNGPNEDEAKDAYINYSYNQLVINLENLINIYKDDMNQKTERYIYDYVSTIRRELMKNDELNEIAEKLYKSHKEALDFIIENRPDPSSELYPIFEEALKGKGWVIGSKNKGYIRFTTEKLTKLLPKGLGQGWPGKEIFLFEIDYFWNNKDITFNSVITPGNEEIRRIIATALEEIQGHKKPGGKKFLVHFKEKSPFVASEIVNEEEDYIKNTINDFISKHEIDEIVIEVEKAILKYEKDLNGILDRAGIIKKA